MKREPFFIDRFEDTRAPGKVIGTATRSGVQRQGIDQEGVIGIDHGALRIQPLIQPGWGRAGLVYGPFQRENGLAFAVLFLNGHNTSQTGTLTESLPNRLKRWARGSETEKISQRLVRWARRRDKRSFSRQFLQWARTVWNNRRNQLLNLDENLALGWFPTRMTGQPLAAGNVFAMHALGPENGELWSRVESSFLPVIRGLQNIPLVCVIVLREKGAAYYVSSLPNAKHLTAFPQLRPVAIDWRSDDETVFAGIYQSVLGQIGFQVDSRVYSVQVDRIAEYCNWYGTAHAADSLSGDGALDRSPAETGGQWQVIEGSFERTTKGACPSGLNNLAVLTPASPSGLIHVLVDVPAEGKNEVSLLWRFQDAGNHWSFSAGSAGCSVGFCEDGLWREVASSQEWRFQPGKPNSLQILDDGCTFSLSLNGSLVFHTRFEDLRLAEAAGTGFLAKDADNNLLLLSFESHPRTVSAPALLDMPMPEPVFGRQVVVDENFTGPSGDLAGKPTGNGKLIWRRELGLGVIDQQGDGTARVRASLQSPNPGRTAYMVDWEDHAFADLQVEIIPPGTGRGQGEKGRGGLIFWQDPENYLVISTWLDDFYEGASMSSFFHLNGYEELYDAVWTNVGKRIVWGCPYTLRVTFDGLVYTTYVNDEPVLYRSLVDVYPKIKTLSINRVGIAANWEWGNDTGSIFKHFQARRAA